MYFLKRENKITTEKTCFLQPEKINIKQPTK